MKKNNATGNHLTEKVPIKHFLLIMRTILILLFTCVFCSMAEVSYTQNARVTINKRNVTLKEVLNEIERQTDCVFIYRNEVNTNENVSLKAKQEAVSEVLDKLFKDKDVSYSMEGNHIILSTIERVNTPEKEMIAAVQQQRKTITGTVRDANGEPIIGANIVEVGTTNGTVTDVDGNFSLSVEPDATIRISYIGYLPQDINTTGKTKFTITLSEDILALEEVVVVGYGQQKKESVVASIVQTREEDLRRSGNITSVEQAMTGLLPGVISILSTGEPGGVGSYQGSGSTGWTQAPLKRSGSASNIYIRGMNTWNGGNPLVLVDGVERNMDNVDIREVESISVLKDASATAVFGVRGANGVIQITTKRGAVGKPVISFNYLTTLKTISKVAEMVNSYDAILIRNEAIERELAINPPSWSEYKPHGFALNYKRPVPHPVYDLVFPDVNWVDAVFDESFSHHASLSVKGGSNFVRYFGILSYLFEDDMFKDYDNGRGYKPSFAFNRFNFRSNFDFSLTKTTNLGLNLSGFYARKNENLQGVRSSTTLYNKIFLTPPDLFLPQYPDGYFGVHPDQTINPVAFIHNLGKFDQHETELNVDLSLTQKLDFITKGLSAKAFISIQNNLISISELYDNATGVRPGATDANIQLKFIDPMLFTGPDQDPAEYTRLMPVNSISKPYYDWWYNPWVLRAETLDGSLLYRQNLYQFQMDYSRKFGLHNVGLLGLFKREENAWGHEFPHYREDWVFRATYDYDSRYLFETNGAYNGSEQFGPGYRFDFFPSVALGWVVSNEKFFKIDWMNRLKLRFSGGLVGSDNLGASRWLYADQIVYTGIGVPLHEDIRNGRSPYKIYDYQSLGNPDIHWEKARKYNYGVEAGLFNNLVSITYDYFTEHRTDMLITGDQRAIPPYFGTTAPPANIGEVEAQGYEIEVKLDKRMDNGLHPWATFAMTHTENKILNRDDPALLPSYMKEEGYAIGQQRTQVRADFMNNWDDIYASVPLEAKDNQKIPGFWNIIDFNGDGVLTSLDAIPYHYSQVPQNTYSTSLGVDYKGFSVMLMFYGVNNVTSYYSYENFRDMTDVVFENLLDAWSKDNQDASAALPRWRSSGGSIGDYNLKDGSYLRLKTVEIAYTFRNEWVKKANLSSLRLYLNGNNLLFWSDLPDDREASFVGGDIRAYPTPKRFNLGIDVTF